MKTPTKRCEYCGEPLVQKIFSGGTKEPASQLARRKFCGSTCQGKLRSLNAGKDPNFVFAHRRARKLIATTICAKCGSIEGRRVVHHVDGNFKNNDKNNLMCLCYRCHSIIHGVDYPHKIRGTCSICGKPHHCRGFCRKHYSRFYKSGDPLRIGKPGNTGILRYEVIKGGAE
jgi:hypothetical protein